MSRVYITLLAIAAFAVSIIGATFSLVGLTELFAGAPKSVGIMAGSLEFSKLVVAGFLYRYWGHVNYMMRYYLSTAVVILSIITSLGIFGFLSNAYQNSSANYKEQSIKKDGIKKQIGLLNTEVAKIEKFIEAIPANRVTKKIQMYDDYRFTLRRLNRQSLQLNEELAKLELDSLVTQKEIGPLLYVAEMTGADVDSVAKFLILIFVSVFDPLAICLVFATNLAIRVREKYRGDELKISALAFSTPVDHRYKNAKRYQAALKRKLKRVA
ncbi:MAG: hypothetical protein IPM57_10320 [Oligoflexia bacterium]|nr:hypothetical protein [Oligoflexia bacterium]